MKISSVYKIVNKINGKLYTGSAVDTYHRWAEHKWYLKNNKHENPRLQNSVNKYGIDNFDFSIIEEVEESKLLEREQYYEDLYQSYIPEIGYNIRRIVSSNLGLKHSEETKKKISLANIGKNLGRKHSLEWIRKSTQNSIGIPKRKKTLEERQQISLRMQKEKVKCICKNCSKIFFRIPCKVSECCGYKCSNNLKVKFEIRKCQTCKKKFRFTNFTDRAGKFCSRSCWTFRKSNN